jgi:SAM domain (Sterile alpha motif)
VAGESNTRQRFCWTEKGGYEILWSSRHSKKQLRDIRGPLQRVGNRDSLHGDAASCASDEASMIHTAAWLEELRLRQYAEAFAEQAIDFEIVPALNDADLEKLGIPHCIDPTSQELLAAVVERVPLFRVLLLVIARPEFTPSWPSYPHVRTIPLKRLRRRDGAALVQGVTGGILAVHLARFLRGLQ